MEQPLALQCHDEKAVEWNPTPADDSITHTATVVTHSHTLVRCLPGNCRINATQSQVPVMNGAVIGEDQGFEMGKGCITPGAREMDPKGSSDCGLDHGTYNTWLSPVQGTLPPEWGDVFPNVEVM